MNTNRIRYHVGSHDLGLDTEYRVECVDTLDEAREWLRHDVEEVAVDVEDDTEFDAFLDRLDGLDIVGEHRIDAFVFFVRHVTDCGCPCDCAETGRECDGEHPREAAAEPQLADADDQGRSAFEFDGTQYAVFNTAGSDRDGLWAAAQVPAEGPVSASSDCLLAGMATREVAFARAVEKLRPTRLITFLPKRYASITTPREEREADEYPTVTADGWVVGWSTDGYAVLFENGKARAHIYREGPFIFATIHRAEGVGSDDLDGEWRFVETAAAAARAQILDARDRMNVEFFPVVVTALPDDEDHAPLLVDPAAARIVRAGDVREGDTMLACVLDVRGRMPQTDYFNDQYTAHPIPYSPSCGCGVCCLLADEPGPVVNLGDDNQWDVCDPMAASALVLIVPA
ncbi:hypothetical protein [Streptomyces sp. Agncl-13]|uniref:hypothetical protein n=1 Tax=Streptomyces sp. Agncl-13 TaxID=3400628 RepID=UPI003A8B5D71